MKKMRIMSLLLALVMAVAIFAGCNTPTEPDPIVVELTVDAESIEMTVGDTVVVTYEVAPEDTEVTFASADNEIAMVDATGKVVALAAGGTELTVTAGDVIVTVALTVAEPVEEVPDPVITLAERDVVIDVGDSFVLDYSLDNAEGMDVLFESENPKIATVDDEGNVKVMGSGETAITITVGDISAAVVVTAKGKVEEIAAVSSAAPPAPSASSSASAASSSASSKPASSVPASSAPASSSSASAVQTASSGYVGAKDECYPINEGGKWYIVLCNKIPAAVAGRKDTITSDIVECGSCGVKINRAGQIVSGSSGSGGTSSSGSSSSASTVDTAAYAREVIRLTNAERVKAGLDELYVVEEMMSAALLRAQEYSEDTSRGHIRPDGTNAADLAASFSSNSGGAENLSWGRNSPSAAVTAWMSSPGHKAAILSPYVEGTAVGCYERNGTLYWSQLFVQ